MFKKENHTAYTIVHMKKPFSLMVVDDGNLSRWSGNVFCAPENLPDADELCNKCIVRKGQYKIGNCTGINRESCVAEFGFRYDNGGLPFFQNNAECVQNNAKNR